MTHSSFDIVIVGGGIAGLWTLAAAREKGLSAILLEKKALGAGQTLASQGIIHGGSKYALSGKITGATSRISDMPRVWQSACDGKLAIDLGKARLLSKNQYLIPTTGIDTKLLSFLGSKSMRSHTKKIKADQMPSAYSQCGISNSSFQLNEIVFDTRSVIKCFLEKYGNSIYQYDFKPENIYRSEDDGITLKLDQHNITIKTQYLVFACGEGFETMQQKQPEMQKRPLHMVIAKGKNLPLIYAHFIGRSSKPLLTITSHPCDESDEVVWYLGGGLAEDGIDLTDEAQIDKTKKLLKQLTPGISIDNTMQFNSFRINRAEQKQHNLIRPDDAFVFQNGRIITGWPTKLALAPRFADQVLEKIDVQRNNDICAERLNLPPALLADYPWQLI